MKHRGTSDETIVLLGEAGRISGARFFSRLRNLDRIGRGGVRRNSEGSWIFRWNLSTHQG